MQLLLNQLRSEHPNERRAALADLCELLGTAYGGAGLEIGRAIRANGGILLLTTLIADPEPTIHQQALLCLGNLASDSVDPDSSLTKQLLLDSGSAQILMACVFSDDPDMLVPACGVLQNVSCDRSWAELVVAHRVDHRLEQLTSHADPMVVRYAAGALTNIAQSLAQPALSDSALHAVAERMQQAQLEDFSVRRAVSRITRGVEAMDPATRSKRVQAAKQRQAIVSASRKARDGRGGAGRPSSAGSSSSSASYVSALSSCTNSSLTSAG